ncbi:MAG: hypothetical protein AB7I25_12385 [Vicinamibacterales bacterium]
MPYSKPAAYRSGNKLVIIVELPAQGELSNTGRSENLVDPRAWHDFVNEGESYGVKLTLCRRLGRHRH